MGSAIATATDWGDALSHLGGFLSGVEVAKDHTLAETTHDRIERVLADFQDGLAASEEVGAQFAQFRENREANRVPK